MYHVERKQKVKECVNASVSTRSSFQGKGPTKSALMSDFFGLMSRVSETSTFVSGVHATAGTSQPAGTS
jgi:hypothetical protein